MAEVLDIPEMLKKCRVRWGSDAEVVRQTGVSRATLWRIDNGRIKFRSVTHGKFTKALLRKDA